MIGGWSYIVILPWKLLLRGDEEISHHCSAIHCISSRVLACGGQVAAVSSNYNCKGYHSTALLAICDAQYYLTFVDLDHYGRNNVAGILKNCVFGKAFENLPTRLRIPKPNFVGDRELPFVLLGNDIFPLKQWLMEPFPGIKLDESQQIYREQGRQQKMRLGFCQHSGEFSGGQLERHLISSKK